MLLKENGAIMSRGMTLLFSRVSGLAHALRNEHLAEGLTVGWAMLTASMRLYLPVTLALDPLEPLALGAAPESAE